jgi:hypothetical protein
LGVSSVVLGWICIMLFEGGGAFCRREPQGQLARNKRVTHHHSSALGHLLAAETKNEIRKGSIKVKKETLVKQQYLSGRNFVFRVNLLQHRTQGSWKT